MDLEAYLRRIGFEGVARPDLATLEAIQRRHLLAVPYEALDVFLGRTLTLDPEAAYDKIVRRRRGGWCYEMNGLMGWALGEIGFEVTRLCGAVMRSLLGEASFGNHLVLRVDLAEGSFLADAGLGEGPHGPYPIAPRSFDDRGFAYRLDAVEDGWMRLHNHPGARPTNFDFHPRVADEAALAARCVALQTDPQSGFLQTLICQRITADGHVTLRGRLVRERTPQGATDTLLGSADELLQALETRFDLAAPELASEIAGAWPILCERHDAVFAAMTPAAPPAA